MKWGKTFNYKYDLNSNTLPQFRVAFVLYILFGLIYLGSFWAEIPEVRSDLKPFLIPVLSYFYWGQASFRKIAILGALFFSFLGDVFLMGSGTLFFLLGLLSFLGAHLCYMSVLWPLWKPLAFKIKSIPILLYGVYALGLLSFLWPVLEDLKIPVLIYALALCFHGVVSLSLALAQGKRLWYLGLGVFLFILSDSMIALNSFYFNADYFREWVMATYLSAQALIILYFIGINQKKQ